VEVGEAEPNPNPQLELVLNRVEPFAVTHGDLR